MKPALMAGAMLFAVCAHAAEPRAEQALSPVETEARLRAALQEVAGQRDASQLRAAQLAGEIAALALRLEALERPAKPENAAPRRSAPE